MQPDRPASTGQHQLAVRRQQRQHPPMMLMTAPTAQSAMAAGCPAGLPKVRLPLAAGAGGGGKGARVDGGGSGGGGGRWAPTAQSGPGAL